MSGNDENQGKNPEKKGELNQLKQQDIDIKEYTSNTPSNPIQMRKLLCDFSSVKSNLLN